MKKYFEIGQRLKKLRGGLNQQIYAKRIGVSYRAYQNYESGESIPKPIILKKIAAKGSVTIDWILTGGLRPLEKKALIKEIELSFLKESRDIVGLRIQNALRKMETLEPSNLNSFIDTAAYLIRLGKFQDFMDLLTIDKDSPLDMMIKRVNRIFFEGDKTKLEAVTNFLKALDPGEKGQDPDAQSGEKDDDTSR